MNALKLLGVVTAWAIVCLACFLGLVYGLTWIGENVR